MFRPWVLLLTAFVLIHPLAALAQQAPGAAGGPELVTARKSYIVKTFNAFTRARSRMKVVSEVSGRCLRVSADVGQAIPVDGLFANLDDTFAALDLEANRVEQERLASKVAYIKKEAARYRSLVSSKSESQSRLDKLENDLSEVRLQLAALKVSGRILAERLARHRINAPPGWLVISRSVEPGQWVATGSMLAELGDFNTLLVPLAFSPEEYRQLKQMPEPYQLTAPVQGLTLQARLERLNPAFDEHTRKIMVEFLLEGGLPEMRGGVPLEFSLRLPDPSGAVLVPAAALEERYQEKWLSQEDGGQIQVVDLGPGPDGARRVVGQGLEPGMRFKLNGR